MRMKSGKCWASLSYSKKKKNKQHHVHQLHPRWYPYFPEKCSNRVLRNLLQLLSHSLSRRVILFVIYQKSIEERKRDKKPYMKITKWKPINSCNIFGYWMHRNVRIRCISIFVVSLNGCNSNKCDNDDQNFFFIYTYIECVVPILERNAPDVHPLSCCF